MDPQTKVFRAHRAISWLYAIAGVGVVAATVISSKQDVEPGAIAITLVFACFFALHHFTATACREGKTWGRRTSQVIGVLFLAGFPMGTIIGIYLLFNASKPWQEAASARLHK